ncbi:MAG TPA: CbiX/SirB N-terminal domain-containing protein [Propionibacteriaceae bacterium]|nr:CbiX/SirB N-terminal domain-containing protein [Propionibacteriaceae bacterium]
MTAPALILVATGTGESRAAEAMLRLRKRLQMSRGDMDVSIAFLDTCPPSGPQVLSVLAARGVHEVVFVPTDLSRATEVSEEVTDLMRRAQAAHPQMRFALARPIGPAVELLNVLDDALRTALHTAHCSEVDGLVLSAPSNGDVRGSALLARRARQWSAHHKLPVHVAVADGHGLNVAQAIRSLRGAGRRHIAVASLWLAPDESWLAQQQLAFANDAVAVSAPICAHEQVCELILARYAYAAMELLTDEMLGLDEVLEDAVGD